MHKHYPNAKWSLGFTKDSLAFYVAVSEWTGIKLKVPYQIDSCCGKSVIVWMGFCRVGWSACSRLDQKLSRRHSLWTPRREKRCGGMALPMPHSEIAKTWTRHLDLKWVVWGTYDHKQALVFDIVCIEFGNGNTCWYNVIYGCFILTLLQLVPIPSSPLASWPTLHSGASLPRYHSLQQTPCRHIVVVWSAILNTPWSLIPNLAHPSSRLTCLPQTLS